MTDTATVLEFPPIVHPAIESRFALQCFSVDQSDRKVPVNLRQSGRTQVELLISTRVRKSPFWHLSHQA